MESNQALFFRTFMVVLAFSILVFGLLILERAIVGHAGTGMYGTPTPPYVAVIGRHANETNTTSSFIQSAVRNIASFLYYGN